MREDRLVLPIPPGTHWKDAMPVLIPEFQNKSGLGILPEQSRRSAAPRGRSGGTPKPRVKQMAALSGVFFAPAEGAKPVIEKPKREKKPKVKFPA